MTNVHEPVMLNEVLFWLKCGDHSSSDKHSYFDGTLGGGGYTAAILAADSSSYVTASDLDPLAIQNFWTFTGLDSVQFSSRVNLINAGFSKAIETLENDSQIGIVLDLGFSSNQLESGERGFSYQSQFASDVFDLRYNKTTGLPAFEKIKALENAHQLGNIIYRNSGEALAQKIAGDVFELCKSKNKIEIVSVGEIVQAITNSVPAKFRNKTNSILSRFWQAIRIWVNNEFGELETFLPIAHTKLKKGGRLVIVSFHSLEDKLVTHWMRQVSEPESDPVYGNKTYYAKLLTKKAILPSPEEISRNPRSRSALLRCLEKELD
ncbi:MAG: 16S rRNA (cytosine(1402)-N(4))-methyltransferase RsmH [Patescibacteria group bacterium]